MEPATFFFRFEFSAMILACCLCTHHLMYTPSPPQFAFLLCLARQRQPPRLGCVDLCV